jgi:hypothetical protein
VRTRVMVPTDPRVHLPLDVMTASMNWSRSCRRRTGQRIPIGAFVGPMASTALTVLAGITASVFFRPPEATSA